MPLSPGLRRGIENTKLIPDRVRWYPLIAPLFATDGAATAQPQRQAPGWVTRSPEECDFGVSPFVIEDEQLGFTEARLVW